MILRVGLAKGITKSTLLTFFRERWTASRSSTACYCAKSYEKRQWNQPEGNNTSIHVYNTASLSVVPLVLKHQNLVKWYICGPTVYDEAHIGHACCYIRFDIIRRILEDFFGIEVVTAMSITDIDDKIIHKSIEMTVSAVTVSKHYEKEFFLDMNALRVKPPIKICRVTEHIDQILMFCSKILDKSLAYVTVDGTVYFDVEKFGRYGVLVQPASDADLRLSIDPHKRSARDFALWKAAKPGEPSWLSPWGKGRPGWHIECSVMASNVFGNQVDLHSGGHDLIFPHHENEEAQSEAYHDCNQWVNYWMHSGHLLLQDNVKMSKSLKNTISIKDFLKENTANDFRMLCLMIPYRSVLEYSPAALELAKGKVKKLKSFLDECEAYIEGELICRLIDEDKILKHLEETRRSVKTFLENDFNTSKAVDAIFELIGEVNKSFQYTSQKPDGPHSVTAVSACLSYVLKIVEMFGVEFRSKQSLASSSDSSLNLLSDVMNAFVDFRTQVRLHALTVGPRSQPRYVESTHRTNSKNVGELPQLPEQPLGQETSTEWTSLQAKRQWLTQTKERDPLLAACDEVRSALSVAGIEVKDRGKTCSWSLITERSLEARKAKLSRHNTFEPDYKPNVKS